MTEQKYRLTIGPEGYLAPAAALMGVVSPDAGYALSGGGIVPESEALSLIAEKLAKAENPAVCPGPLLLWHWADGVPKKAAAVRAMAEACNAKILPMPDYRAKSPRINPEIEINPNHPSLTIQHNNIDVCLFAGMHLHFANMALRLIRGATNCYTIALSDTAAIDEAILSVRDVDVGKIEEITKRIHGFRGQ
ncbi:carbon monoxide dehydrogenase subunit beta [Fibrobacteres bacterium R8-0-B4]